MAHFVPIGPPSILRPLIENCSHYNNHLMLLAPHVLKYPIDHEMLLKGFKGKIFLDNGAAELGISADFDCLQAAFNLIREVAPKSQIVVCYPDALEFKITTLDLVKRYHLEWESLDADGYMAIPQGTTHEEYMNCFHELREILGSCDFWGVPRHMTAKLGTRRWLIEDLAQQLNDDEKIHMLGFGNHLADDLACARMPEVYSIDSQVPTMYGCLNIAMHEHMQIVRDVHYWDYAEFHGRCTDNIRWIYRQVHNG